MKFFIYARKSTDDEGRQVLSIDSQLDELREYARKESLTVVREYIEAQTAKEPGRPVFNEMMEAIEEGEVGGLLAWHPDRLSRNSVDAGRLLHDLDTKKLQALSFPSFWFENTPQGKFVLSLALGIAKYQIDHLSEQVRRGIRKKLRDGVYPNMPPPGYMNDPRTRTIVFDEERAPLVRRMFETYATGDYSGADMKRMVKEWGLVGVRDKPLSLSRVHSILANPFYIGIFRFSGEVYEGKHRPLITRELFKRVQAVRQRRGRRRRPKKHPFPLRGLIQCHECGCMVTATKKKGHTYYHCGHRRGPCPTKTMREETLAELLRESIRRASIPEDWADKMLAEVETWKRDEEAKEAEVVAGQTAELDRMQERLDRLLDAYIEGILDKDEFAARKEQYVNRKAELADSVARFESGGASRLEPLVSFITDSRQARYEAESDDLTDLRKWHNRVGSNLLFASEVIQMDGVPTSPSGVGMSETVTAHAVRVGEKSQEPDGASVRSKDGSRGVPAARSVMSNHQNHAENGTFSAVAGQSPESQPARRSRGEVGSEFFPILPADVSAGDSAFRFLGSKTDPILHVSYPSPWNVVADFAASSGENRRNQNWRCLLKLVGTAILGVPYE